MSAIVRDLGIATAYGYAKSQGYTGTEQEFAILMASYATVAQQAAASASDAEAYGAGTRGGDPVESGDAAYHNNAQYYAGQAQAAAETLTPATVAEVLEYLGI